VAVRLRLTRKLANLINGIDLTGLEPGDEFDLPSREALLLLAEGWAVPVDGSLGAPDDRSRLVAPPPRIARRLSARHTVLVVDDEPSTRGSLRQLLRRHGFHARTATNATEAIALLDVLPVDAIVLDIRMPGRSGLTVLRHVRQQPGLDHIPVLVLAGATLTTEEAATIAAARADVFYKPTNIGKIVGYLKKLFARHQKQP